MTAVISRPRLLRSWPAHCPEAVAEKLAGRVILWPDPSPGLVRLVQSLEPVRSGSIICILGPAGESDVTSRQNLLMSGSLASFRGCVLALADGGWSSEADLLKEVVEAPDSTRLLRLPDRTISFEVPAVVGVLNVTPDSFFDGGRDRGVQDSVSRGLRMIDDGATIVEVGGEKAGPGEPVTVAEELRRVLPVIEGLKVQPGVLVSIDTRKPEVARRAIEAGAGIVNDINGMRDPKMREVVAGSSAAVVVMHIQGEPRVHQPRPAYDSVIGDVSQVLHAQIEALKSDGIEPARLAIDPGPAFGKSTPQDLSLLAHWAELRGFPQPVMLAVSRKRFIGETLDLPVEKRLRPTLALTAFLIGQGVDLIRAHDVPETVQTVNMISAVLNHGHS